MYHLLNLYLTTPHLATQITTASLISKLFASSVLFEHDPQEITTWLTSLLDTSRTSSATKADAVKLQVLLPFLDDCLKRCLKTPYKYLEESLEFDASPQSPHHSELPSPLFVTLLEQLAAKIKAKLLKSDEVEVLASFIAGLALALAGKQQSLGHAEESARRTDLSLTAAGLGSSQVHGRLAGDLKALLEARQVAAEAAAVAKKASGQSSRSYSSSALVFDVLLSFLQSRKPPSRSPTWTWAKSQAGLASMGRKSDKPSRRSSARSRAPARLSKSRSWMSRVLWRVLCAFCRRPKPSIRRLIGLSALFVSRLLLHCQLSGRPLTH